MLRDMQSRQSPTASREGARGFLAISGTVLLFSWGAIIVKAIALSPFALVFWRLVIGAVLLGSVALATRSRAPTRWRDTLAAGLLFGLHQLAFVMAVQATSIAVVAVVAALQPLAITLVSGRVLGEPVPPGGWAWAVLAVLGVGLVVQATYGHTGHSVGGDLFSLLNLAVFTGFFLFAKRARQTGVPTLTLTSTMLVVALACVLPVFLLTGAKAPARSFDWALLTFIAVGPGSGHILLNWAHARVRAALASLMLTAVPLLASLWAHWIYAEPFGARHILGMAMVAVAIEGGRRADVRNRLLGAQP